MNMTIADFLLAQIARDEVAATRCAEMFPSPWEIADRGWRVRIYASDVPTEDMFSDDPDAMTVRNPVVIEVEPDQNIEDPRWLSERVAHIVRHDPARVLRECEAKRRIVEAHTRDELDALDPNGSWEMKVLALPYADHPDFDPAWKVGL